MRFPFMLRLTSLAWKGAVSLTLLVLIVGMTDAAWALQRGSRGSRVSLLQRQLKEAGYYTGSLTGRYDFSTEAAVSQFQQQLGMPVTGVADDATLAALRLPAHSSSRLLLDGRTGGKLARGSYGPEVKVLQTQLTAACYTESPITNNYDSLTEVGVRRVQNAQGVFRDGVLGPETRLALKRQLNAIQIEQGRDYDREGGEYSGAKVLRQGSRGPEVAVLQNQLKVAGYFSDEITGCYGSSTRAAVQRFQRANELPDDGILSSTTRTLLKRELNQLQVAAGSRVWGANHSVPAATGNREAGGNRNSNYQVPTYLAPSNTSVGRVAPAFNPTPASNPTPYNFSVPPSAVAEPAPVQDGSSTVPWVAPQRTRPPSTVIPSYSVPTYQAPVTPATESLP